jgi:hypothetical protein
MIPRPRRAALGFALAAVLAAVPAGGNGRPGPKVWDIQIVVEAKGRYGLESQDIRYDGTFAFTSAWVGLMEKDDEDYLLVHKSCELEKWEASEKETQPTANRLLQTADFAEKPDLRVRYVLKTNEGLVIDFYVRGFDVPRTATADVFYLALPAAAENQLRPGGVDYNTFIAKGTNKIVIPEKAIQRGVEVKEFAWDWKFRNWVQKQDRMVLTTHTHAARVVVTVTPHQEAGPAAAPAPGLRPADETYRTPGAAVRG